MNDLTIIVRSFLCYSENLLTNDGTNVGIKLVKIYCIKENDYLQEEKCHIYFLAMKRNKEQTM